MSKKMFFCFTIVFLPISVVAQIVLSEIMYDPIGPEASDEFVEIVNIGHQPVDLSGWFVGDQDDLDEMSAPPVIHPGQYALIVDSDYDTLTGSYRHLIPDSTLLIYIDGTTIGSRGFSNSTAETVLLVNSLGDTVDAFRYSLGNSPGFSEERRDLFISSDSSNWADSEVQLGTPGFVNSVAPRAIDLAVVKFEINSTSLLVNVPALFEFAVVNQGQQTVPEADWLVFADSNGDRKPQEDEKLVNGKISEIAAGNQKNISVEVVTSQYGYMTFGLQIFAAGDQFAENDTAFLQVFVDDPQTTRLRINEIMFEPATDQPEWVEIVNAGSKALDVKGVFFGDLRDTVSFSAPAILLPGEFLLLSGDSLVFADPKLGSMENVVILPGFPTLNNAFDEISILGPGGAVYDRLVYSDEWYGREVEAGTSLEKINPEFDGRIGRHWAASVAGASPGRQNSVYVRSLPAENRISISPNPFSPDGDGHDDVTVINFEWSERTTFVEVRLFDLRGRQLRTLVADQPVAAGGHLVWDGKDDSGRVMRIGAYICLIKAMDLNRAAIDSWKETVILYKQ